MIVASGVRTSYQFGAIAVGILLAAQAWGIPPDAHRAFVAAEPHAKSLGGSPMASFRRAALVGLSCDYTDTGGDRCSDATTIDLPVGPPGGGQTITVCGDNSAATAADCGPSPLWWEVFRIDQCADVTLSLCGTTPVQQPSLLYLWGGCPCQSVVLPTVTGRGGPICEDDNAWAAFRGLPAGTYYYPVFSDATQLVGPPGPYELHLTAEACSGACCDSASGVCSDLVLLAECSAPGQQWFSGVDCCTIDCVAEGETYDFSGLELLAHVPLGEFSGSQSRGNDVWGYTSPSGREYVLMGMDRGVGFVEISSPQNPVIVGHVSSLTSVTWRDMKTYGHHAYLVSDGDGVGLQIVDLSDIDSGAVFLRATDRLGVNLRTAHNIYINTASGYAYLCGANAPTSGLVAVDLGDPETPVIAGSWSESYVHDVYVRSFESCPYAGRAGQPCEIAYAFAGGDGLKIVDVTDKVAITTIGSLVYPTIGYCHQGWLSEDGQILFFNDEADESAGSVLQTTTYVADVSAPASPSLITTFSSGKCSIDHNLMVRGDRVYEANYSSGLHVFDVSDVNDVHEVAYFDTHPEGNATSFDGAWGVYAGFNNGIVAVSDINRGLFIFADGMRRDPVVPMRNRAVSLVPEGLGPQTAIRVTLNRLYIDRDEDPDNGCPVRTTGVDLSEFEGEVRWAAAPAEYSEDTTPPMRNFVASSVTCCPGFRDWRPAALAVEFGDDAATSVLHLVGPDILPCSIYDVQAVNLSCPDLNDEKCYSPITRIRTSKFGDVWEPVGGVSQPNFIDIGQIVEKFKGIPFEAGPPPSGAPQKSAALLRGNSPPLSEKVNFIDIGLSVKGFKIIPYTESVPQTCGPCP